MSYRIEKGTNDVIISGWEQGIADDPYSGIADIRNTNLISIPKEASVNFSTAKISNPTMGTGTMTSANAAANTIHFNALSPEPEANMAIIFSAVTGGIGLSTGVVYWLGNTGVQDTSLYTNYDLSSLVDITGTGTGTFTFVTMTGYPKHFTQDSGGNYYCIDSTGRVWSNIKTTTTNGYWIFTGNITLANANGNGLVSYTASDGTIYLFAFRNGLIDFLKPAVASPAWVYGWKPSDGSTANTGTTLKTLAGVNNSHEALVAPDNKVYFCDANWIGRFYQADPDVPFVPTTVATYVTDNTQVLPFIDIANCLAPLGNNLLIGGQKNIIYPWDTFDSLPTLPIFIAENNIQKMVTVNTNTYIFVGNRGRIWVTNGSQAQFYKKLPDHISGTVEPYYVWGGATSNKNQLYFSASVTTNAGVAITQYGGVWGIDLDTKAIRLTNKLSYGTYAGYATAIIPVTPYSVSSNPTGTGLYIGWSSGASTYGIDGTVSAPYANGEALIDSDLIPLGTYLKPQTNTRVEFKLAVPLVSGESVQMYYRQKFSDSFTAINNGEAGNGLFNTPGDYSGICQNLNFEKSQWIQIRTVLTSTATTPSYVRLIELRLGQ